MAIADNFIIEIAPGGEPSNPAGWSWVDVTNLVRIGPGISIGYGRKDESSRVSPSSCTLTVDNNSGDWVPENPLGQWYGDLDLGTPLRVRWDDGINADVRFVGLIYDLPTTWDMSASDATSTITAAGVLRRLVQLDTQVASTLRRAVTAAAAESFSDVVGYWPMEDGGDATQAQSPMDDVEPLIITGYEMASDDSLAGSSALPVLEREATSKLEGIVPGYSNPTGNARWRIEFVFYVSSEEFTSGSIQIIKMRTSGFEVDEWELRLTSGGTVQIFGNDTEFGNVVSQSIVPGEMFDQWLRVAFQVTNGVDGGLGRTFWEFQRTVIETGDTFADGDNADIGLGGWSAGRITNFSRTTASAVAQRTTGHIAVFREHDVTVMDGPDNAHFGELAADRIERLCGEEDIPYTLNGTAADTMPMGYQLAGKLMSLLHEAEITDGGVLHEASGGLAYTTRNARYNQTVQLALDVDAGHVGSPPVPTRDDQRIVNDVSVSQEDGSQFRATDEESVAKIGRYAVDVNINVGQTRFGEQIARARLYRAMASRLRWPSLILKLHDDSTLIPSWLGFDLDSNRITLAHALSQLTGIDVDLLGEGWDERIGFNTWDVSINCVPAEPYTVGVLDQSRLDSNGVTVASSFEAGVDTSMSVNVSGPLLTTDVTQFPLEIIVSGVQLEVTAISGASSPQTMTITQTPVNGVEKTISAGAVVQLADPMRLRL